MHEVLEKKKNYYFSDHLKRQLANISNHPLTIIEAPSGFGKTTAVREFLKGNLSGEAHEYWHTCLGESSSTTWLNICEMISKMNEKVADDLKNLEMPTKNTLNYMLSLIKNIKCNVKTFMVVDNYQRINGDVPYELINVLSSHGNSNLHLIFITQQIETRDQFIIHSENIHLIDGKSFFFDRRGIFSLFHMRGIKLSDEELEKIFMSTEGWVAAINLQMISYINTGSLAHAIHIEQLVEYTIWNHLDVEEKDFLLSVSILDSFSTQQAAIMICQDILPDKIQTHLKNSEFIKYLPDKSHYSIHSILHDYLTNRFYHYTSLEYQNSIYRRAGVAYTVSSRFYKAAQLYYKIGDFDAILSLPFDREYLDQGEEKGQYEFYMKIINECPEDILCKHPLTMIIFGYMSLMNGYYIEYNKLQKLLDFVIQNETCYNQTQFQRINAEFLFLKSVAEFNDMIKMQESYKKCWELLGGPSDIISTRTSMLYGGVSVLNMLWRESGKLEEVLQYMEKGRTLNLKLTRGHGAGAYYAMMAEVSLMRGDDKEAEIQCYKALYEAQSFKNIDIQVCVKLLFVRIAILRGDVEGYFSAVKNIQNYPNENTSLYVLQMVEYCMSIISLLLNDKDYVSPWFYDMENIKKTVYAPVVPHAQLIHFFLLILEKRYNQFYAMCQYEIDQARNSTQNIKYVMPQVYRLIFFAVAKRSNGEYLEAQKYLKEALNLALPDKVYLPFAQQECMIEFLSELNTTHNNTPNTRNTNLKPDFLYDKNNDFEAIIELCKRQKKGVSIIRKAIHQGRSPLTPREREIALLAKERLSAKEIADMLYISDMTVKATLRSVYSKLDVHSKAELNLKEF